MRILCLFGVLLLTFGACICLAPDLVSPHLRHVITCGQETSHYIVTFIWDTIAKFADSTLKMQPNDKMVAGILMAFGALALFCANRNDR